MTKTYEQQQAEYRNIFLRAKGHGPHHCHFCGQLIRRNRGNNGSCLVVHHEDEDRSNNSISNLKPAHQRCHNSYHKQGNTNTLGKRWRWRADSPGRAIIAERNRQYRTTGVLKTAAHRANLSAAQSKRWQCDECPYGSSAAHLGRHQLSTGHQGRHEAGESV